MNCVKGSGIKKMREENGRLEEHKGENKHRYCSRSENSARQFGHFFIDDALQCTLEFGVRCRVASALSSSQIVETSVALLACNLIVLSPIDGFVGFTIFGRVEFPLTIAKGVLHRLLGGEAKQDIWLQRAQYVVFQNGWPCSLYMIVRSASEKCERSQKRATSSGWLYRIFQRAQA